MTDLIDTRLGPYHLTEVLGRGGMATIYKAYQPSLERFVAVKVLRHDHDPHFAARFKREALAIAHLQHPNILPVYEFGEQNGRLYLVCQYIENGATLADMLGSPLESVAAVRLLGHLLGALEYAHNHGVIHRDIKPSNVLMLSPTWPMLADFGIVRLTREINRLTISGTIIGTAAYMAPEQASGAEADARSDLYAAGIVLYELLTGRVPFDADTPVAVLLKHTREPPPPPRELNPNIPIAIEAALLRALAKDPAERYQSADEMTQALAQAASRVENGALRTQLEELHRLGLREFRAGHWVAAIDVLSRLVALDPSFEDGPRLLEQARTAQEFAEREARRRNILKTTPFERETIVELPAEPSVEPVRCARCGNETQPKWTNCPYCGAALKRVTPATQQHLSQLFDRPLTSRLWLRDHLWIAAGLLALVLALLSGGAWLIFGSGDPPQPSPTAIPTADSQPGAVLATVSEPTSAPTLIPTVPLLALAPTSAPEPTPTSAPTPTPEPTPTPAPTEIPTPVPDAVVEAELWNLRSGPSTAFSSLGQYDRGVALQVIGKEPSGEWLKVQMPDEQAGWMAAEGLHLNLDLAEVPVVPVPPTPTLPPTQRLPTPRPAAQPTPPTVEPPTVEPPTAVPTPEPPSATPTEKKRDPGCRGNCIP